VAHATSRRSSEGSAPAGGALALAVLVALLPGLGCALGDEPPRIAVDAGSGEDTDTGSAGTTDLWLELDTTDLICVFDIDSTLTCSNAAEAVSACKDLGASLAVNTAEGRTLALKNKSGLGYVDWGALGFPTVKAALDMEHGAFVFGLCMEDCSCSEEFGGAPGDCEMCNDCGPECPESYMGKAYGMSRIAEHYGAEDPTCLVLLDDLKANTDKVEAFGYSAYWHGPCAEGWNSEGTYEEVHGFLTSGELDHCFEQLDDARRSAGPSALHFHEPPSGGSDTL
jgi:hypothetical protein